jgi:hypothetical protein
MTRIRFEGLRSPALSAPFALPCRAFGRYTWVTIAAPVAPRGLRTVHAGRVLRLLRDPALTRVLAVAVVVGLVVLSAPVLLPLVRWVFGLL